MTDIATECGVTRGSVNRWLQWYDVDHIDGLRTSIAEGPAPKLTDEQRERTTHNRFYETVEERDAALCSTFETFHDQPSLIVNHVARFL